MIKMQLGKLPAIRDNRNLNLPKYLKKIPEHPDHVNWADFKPVSDWGMMGNDVYGNCVIVTAAHIIDCARANESNNLERIPDKEVVALSAEMGALNGYYILRRLKRWRKEGMWGSKIKAFVDIEPVDHRLICAAIYCFGHVDIGLLMAKAWENSNFWDAGTTPAYIRGSWGGHSVPLLGYYQHPEHGLVYYACTWGRIIEITAKAVGLYSDEIYVSILEDWYASDGIAPSELDLTALEKDLQSLD